MKSGSDSGRLDREGAAAIGLNALAWTLGEPTRADRLLALTGLTPDDLRTRIDDPSAIAAVLGFLEGNEDDLVACAQALDMPPMALVQARAALEA